jgi:hypothetical protein
MVSREKSEQYVTADRPLGGFLINRVHKGKYINNIGYYNK